MSSLFDDDDLIEHQSAEPLFLPDDDDNEGGPAAPPPEEIDLPEFDDIDNDQFVLDLEPLNIEQERRKAFATAQREQPSLHEVTQSSSPARENEKGERAQPKARKRALKLDEDLLVGPTGFEQLIKSTKHFKIKGKGHEACPISAPHLRLSHQIQEADLGRLLKEYQFWTHRMYPKTQFKDTVERVEKLCHSRRMHVSRALHVFTHHLNIIQSKLSVYRDEAKGKKPAEQTDPDDVIDLTEPQGANGDVSDAAEYASSSAPPTRPPSSAAFSDRPEADDWDFDATMREAAARSEPTRSNIVPAVKAVAPDLDDDADMWDGLDDLEGPQPVPTKNQETPEDMWDLIDEMEHDLAEPQVKPPPVYVDDSEDLYT